MSVAETLFNGTLVLVPIWLGVVRYITTESEFRNSREANVVGLGVTFVLIGILFSMSLAIEQLVKQSEGLRIALYALFGTIALTGGGGVLFIIREIEQISPLVVTGVPVGMAVIGVTAVILPQIIRQLPSPSIPRFLGIVGTTLMAIITQIIIRTAISKFVQLIHEVREREWGENNNGG